MASPHHIEGYEVPVHRALTTSRMVAGIPRDMAVLLFTAAAALVLGLQSWWSLPLYAVLHIGAAMVTRHEPQWPEALRRSLHLKSVYRA